MDPTIWIKSFNAVPMADVELVFPHKKICTRTIDLVQFWVALVIALLLALKKIFDARSAGSDLTGAGIMVLMLLGSKAAQMYGKMTRAMQQNKDLMTKLLYQKSLDTGDGVLLELLDSMGEQEVAVGLEGEYDSLFGWVLLLIY